MRERFGWRAWRRPRALAACASVAAVGLFAQLPFDLGCEKSEPPCRVAGAEPVVQPQPGAAALQPRLRVQTDGSIAATWLGFGQIAADAGPTFRVAQKARAVVLESDGTRRNEVVVDAPKSLTDRKGSTENVSAEWTGRGFLFRWNERLDHTNPDGRPAWTTVARAQFVAVDGAGGPLVTLALPVCESCALATSATTFGDRTFVAYTVSPTNAVGIATLEGSRVFVATFARDGALVSEVEQPWLQAAVRKSDAQAAATLGAQSASTIITPALFSDATGIFVASETRIWIADENLAPVAGPLVLPKTANFNIVWNPGERSFAASFAASAQQFAEAGVAAEPDLYFAKFGSSGEQLTGTRRFSTGTIISLVRNADRFGAAVLSSDDSMYFAWTHVDGLKIGGDTPFPDTFVGRQLELMARGPNQFVAIQENEGALYRREIRCGD